MSEQSTIISGREVDFLNCKRIVDNDLFKILTSKEEALEKKYVEGGEPVPRPDWGGYR